MIRRPSARRGPGVLASGALAVTLLVLYTPLVYMTVSSINTNPLSGAWQGFTTRWYSDAYNDESARRALGTSLRLALITAVAATATGTLAAIAVRRRTHLANAVRGLAAARLAAPEIIMATGLSALLPAIGAQFGFRTMAIAHTAYLSAYVTLLVAARAAGANPHHEQAALDLGARPFQVLRHIILPDLRPAIIASALLVAAFSFDDIALSLALRGPDDTTLPVYLLSAAQRRVTPAISAIGVTVMTVGLATFITATTAHRSLLRGEHD